MTIEVLFPLLKTTSSVAIIDINHLSYLFNGKPYDIPYRLFHQRISLIDGRRIYIDYKKEDEVR